ncbi:MAG: AAA family ATPase [Candidatus Bathyarchaeia archaeon]
MLIREVILENFMSYEYARIPFKPGLNVICGPNGAGKSSILLGISISLGQSYTERSRKLSDLIRRGKDQGRCTLILDNRERVGKRPVPRIGKDDVILSRYLRADGKYWFEIEGKAASKSEVDRLLSRFDVDPENMLIIMHQNMVEQFIVLSPQEKLRMLEAAIGLEAYRQNVLNAEKKLSRILSEKESVNRLLESAEQTLNYWRERYDRYQKKKQLRIKRRFLERELAWSRVKSIEEEISRLNRDLESTESEASSIEEERIRNSKTIEELRDRYAQIRKERQSKLEELLSLKQERARKEAELRLASREVEEIEKWSERMRDDLSKYSTSISMFEGRLRKRERGMLDEFRGVQQTLDRFIGDTKNFFEVKLDALKEVQVTLRSEIEKLNKITLELENMIGNLEINADQLNEALMRHRIDDALLSYKREDLEKRIERLRVQSQDLNEKLSRAYFEAERHGPRLVTFRNEEQILDEIRFTDGHLLALSDVSEDVENMYESYSKIYLDLKEKANEVEENRRKALEEVKLRMESWKKVIWDVIEKIKLRYQSVLSKVNAAGDVKLINEDDIERAGITLYVGFKGTEPVPLDIYTQSGGERSTATMAFLIALQQHIRSPFRAVDEYDIHMDPKNREIIAELLLSVIENSDVQYLVITPSQLNFNLEKAHIITVQNIEGSSIVTEMV